MDPLCCRLPNMLCLPTSIILAKWNVSNHLTVPVTEKKKKDNMVLTNNFLNTPPNFPQTPITLRTHF